MSSTTVQALMAERSYASRRRSPVRLTRRGRAVVVLLALIALAAVGLLGASISGAAQHRGGPVPTHTVVVGPGDTLWDYASNAANGGSVLDMEQRIRDLNGLDSGMLLAGQTLRIPD